MGTIGPSSGPGRASAASGQQISHKNNNNNIMGGSGISKLERLQTGGGASSSAAAASSSSSASSSPFAHLQGPAAAMATHLHNFSTNFGCSNKSPVSPSVSPSSNHTCEAEPAAAAVKSVVEVVNGFANKNNGQLSSSSPAKRSAIPPKPPPKPSFIKKSPFVNLQGSRPGSPLSNHSSPSKAVKKSKNTLATRRPSRQLVIDANCCLTVDQLWLNQSFLERFFNYFSPSERVTLAQVCVQWKTVIYQPRLWRNCSVVPALKCKSVDMSERIQFYHSLQQRGLDSICLLGANDEDVLHLVNACSAVAKYMRHVILRCCSVTDKGLENMLDGMPSVYHLELSGCNEVSEAGLWSALDPRILSLSITDCINVADESLGAVAQLLPSLYEFNLQAYHVTDVALSYFSQKQSSSLNILRLQSCWEISNQGVSNMVHCLPNLTILSLSGCTKLTDAGVEMIAENLKKLRSLDLSWCSRITDAALEYIACDLTQLEQLTLDRCVHITDIGVGYISTMISLQILFLRWCSQMGDFGLQHLCSMRNLHILSVAGCSLLTVGGLSALVQLRNLRELELTNCPGASAELFDYLHQHLPRCLIIE